MPNPSQGKNYRTLLLERQGKSFSEFEVTEMLRQVLPQLAEVHVRGQAHGSVFLDNLVYDMAGDRLLLVGANAPEKQQPGQASISKDIYALGVAAIALLTAQPINLLRHPDGSWSWEDYCTASDQLAVIINCMIADKSPNSFASASEVLSALSFSPAKVRYDDTVQVLPAIDQNSANLFVPPTALSFDNNPLQQQHQILIWQWTIIGIGVILLAGIVGFVITKKINNQSELSASSEVTPQSQLSPSESSIESRSPPPRTAPPTPPQTSSPTSVDNERISFASGSTGTTIRGNISPAQIKRYLVNSGEGQQFSVRILQGNVNVAVIDPSGVTLGRATNSATFWQGRLPRTGDYAVEITSQNNSDYAVSVEVLTATVPQIILKKEVGLCKVPKECHYKFC